jgi:hypothetical protein
MLSHLFNIALYCEENASLIVTVVAGGFKREKAAISL